MAIEGIKAFQAKVKKIDAVICDFEKTIEKNIELIKELGSPELTALLKKHNKQENIGLLLEKYKQEINAAQHSITSLKQCRETLMSQIGLNIESEKSMQTVMEMPPLGRA